jgi:Holliday junction resolvase RusA-like endonuclease
MNKKLVFEHSFEIEPTPASRPRVTRWGVFYGKKYKKFKETMEILVAKHVPRMILQEMLHVESYFVVKTPKSYSKKKKEQLSETFCASNIDNDNLEKALWDSMNGHLWEDDRQIVSNYTEKRWSSEEPSITIKVFVYE